MWTDQADIPIIYFDNVVDIQSFDNGLFNIDDNQIDLPIITNSKQMPDFPSMHSKKTLRKRITIVLTRLLYNR